MSDIITALKDILDSGGVLTGVDVTSRVAGWAEGACEALAVVRPRNTSEVSEVMKLCNQYNQSVVTEGGKTGMVRGCIASPGDIALSLERMNTIEELDTANGTATVQAGVPLQLVQEAAEAARFCYPMDLGARGSATIGGTISTNAGGNRVIRYGMTRGLVLGLEVVMADGTIVSSMNKMIKNNAGYDLKQLFIGSEGTLGIVTRAVLKLSPALNSQQTALVALERFEQVISLLQHCQRELGGQLCAFEVMWNSYFQLVTGDEAHQKKAPMDRNYPFYVLIESAGADQDKDTEAFEYALNGALEEGLICDAVLSKSHAERNALWEIRDNIEALFTLYPFYGFDISLPLDRMAQYLADIEQTLSATWPTQRHVVFGHLGDGNLHIVVTTGSEHVAEKHRVEDVVYSALETYGGSISAEHGIGLEKKNYLHHSRSTEELALMRLLKTTLDPKNLLNPGKLLDITVPNGQ
ncbi:MAG: FAD-binding oxidoreductase [Halioglobus sp.]